jgi:uncharacterized protein YbjT (DUF2867 family)
MGTAGSVSGTEAAIGLVTTARRLLFRGHEVSRWWRLTAAERVRREQVRLAAELKGDTMTTAVIGATGRVGGEIVRGVLARGDAVTALVRDPGKARRAFGEPGGLHLRPTRLDDPRDLTEGFDGIRTVFVAMGSIGIEGVVQRMAINAAAGIHSIEQVTRLSVLDTSADSLGINQRAHYSIDQFASSTGVPYSTIRPAIFSASLLAAAPEVRTSHTWTGLAGSGRVALLDHRDAAEAGLRVYRAARLRQMPRRSGPVSTAERPRRRFGPTERMAFSSPSSLRISSARASGSTRTSRSSSGGDG